MSKTCKICGDLFSPKTSRHIYCSNPCRTAAIVRPETRSRASAISPSTSGAISEMIAAVALAKDGFDVFRAISPSAPCDLIATRAGLILRIEVRTGAHFKSGISWSCPPKDANRSDFYAVVSALDEVYFVPTRTATGRIPAGEESNYKAINL